MKILIVGAGAIGSLLGARFIQAGYEVYFLDKNLSLVEEVKQDGIFIVELDGSITNITSVNIFSSPDETKEKMDLVLFCVKSYATSEAVKTVVDSKIVDKNSLFLSLQNGIGNREILWEAFGKERTVVGTTSQGATLIGYGKIQHGGVGPTYLGTSASSPDVVRPIVELFEKSNLEVHVREDIEVILWEKLIVNVGINAVTAIAGILNGEIFEFEPSRELSLGAVREAIEVAKALGIPVREDMENYVIEVAKATSKNRSSMRQDIEGKRPTEIDAINGAIVRFGAEKNIDTPVNWVLTKLVKTIELRNLKESR